MRALLLLIMLCLGAAAAQAEPPKEKTWADKRADRPDLYYPHQIHDKVMRAEGDPCLRCHAFSGNAVTDLGTVKALTAIANEPLEAICHDCHVERLTAPWRCALCHSNPAKIWPRSHDFDYVARHGEDARRDQRGCSACHIDTAFCADCHLRREGTARRVHLLGYRSRHGLDARLDPAGCGACHGPAYCSDCHRGVR